MTYEKITKLSRIDKDKGLYRYILSLGSNLGNRSKNCRLALTYLKKITIIKKRSRLIQTSPLKSKDYDTSNHAPYLNQVIEIETSWEPGTLYEKLRMIESRLGHNHLHKWQPRHMDLDILFWRENNASCFTSCTPLSYNQHGLMVPHKEVQNRPFLLTLMKEIHPSSLCKTP